ncbi:hypothetical protein Cni_G11618 [Canna indica]|uniref:Nuclear matrix constituent protein 1-like protein n=1 Tax=Canna indica TaxID=4628 RepID=A0AAQ3K849_9LILI|nr:hypothetical protein Cni_G11618 [Canna indica]
MFTPQRKGWSISPRIRDADDNGLSSAANPRVGLGAAASLKGKGKSVVEAPPPPQGLLGENGGGAVGASGEVEAWRSFREAGFLDEAAMQRKDREALVQRITELEKELHEYQYNMGLLLIEKKESIAKYEEVAQALAEAREIIKREQASHIIAISEYEKREENWQKALGIEKQTVVVLEKDLREVRSQIAEAKFTSEKKLAEAQALESGLEEKYLEIEGKAHAADAKLAEANRKISEINRKLDDVEARERKLQKEYLSLTSERKAHEKDLNEQREYLLGWEKRLQNSQQRLVEGQRLLNEREDRANELDQILKKKQAEVEEAEKVIIESKKSLKLNEEDIGRRLSSLASKEKEANIKFESLEKKERDLFEKEEIINARERVEIQKLLDDHNSMLDSKKQEFELEMEKRREAFNAELKMKIVEVEEKKKEIDNKEEKIVEREHVLEINMLKLKEMEKDLDSKSQVLKKWEESVNVSEKKLENEKQQLERDRQELMLSISELETLKASIEAGKVQIFKEEEQLKLTKKEREEHTLLQATLKQEIEDYRMMKDSLNRDMEDLRQQREKFEKEWELLDEKRLALDSELKKINEEREMIEKWKSEEEERIRNEVQGERICLEREREDLWMEKEAFEKTMEHERLEVHEMLKRERADLVRDMELRKHELEMEMLKKQEVMEKDLQDRESEFRRNLVIEKNEMKSLSNANELLTKKLEVEQERLEREKEDFSVCRRKLENDQLEIQKDIDTLRLLSKDMKDQREKFVKERDHFLSLAEQCKICKSCGLPVHDLELLSLQDTGVVQLPSLTFEDQLKAKSSEKSPQPMVSPSVTSGSRLSWLKKCSRIFSSSPTKKTEDSERQHENNSISLGERLDREALAVQASDEPVPSQGIVTKSFDSQGAQSSSGIREKEGSERLGRTIEEPEPSLGMTDNSADIIALKIDNTNIHVNAEQVVQSKKQRERGESSIPLANDSQIEPAKGKTRQRAQGDKPKRTTRTRTVKAVVEEAKHILGENSNDKNVGPNGQGKHSPNIQEASKDDLIHAGQKRGLSRISVASEQDVDSETRSESISLGGRRKRRQIISSGAQTPGEKRYNFRRSTIAAAATAVQSVPGRTKGLNVGVSQQPNGDETLKGDGDGEGTSKLRVDVEPASSFVAESVKSVDIQKTIAESAMEIQEISQKLVQRDMEFHNRDAGKSVEFSGQTREDEVVADGATSLETEPVTPDGGWSEGDSDEDEDDPNNHNASIGKKLWTFFTT